MRSLVTRGARSARLPTRRITDGGVIADRLTGYRVPADDLPGGKGLWLVNQACDLVEVRTVRTAPRSACT